MISQKRLAVSGGTLFSFPLEALGDWEQAIFNWTGLVRGASAGAAERSVLSKKFRPKDALNPASGKASLKCIPFSWG